MLESQTLDALLLLYSLGFQLLFDMHKAIVKTFLFFEVIIVHQMVKHFIHCCYGISWVPIFCLICIKLQLKHFYFGGHFRLLEVIDGQTLDSLLLLYWFLAFVCIKPQLKHFHFWRSFRTLEVVRGFRRSNTGFVDATVFLGFLAFN